MMMRLRLLCVPSSDYDEALPATMMVPTGRYDALCTYVHWVSARENLRGKTILFFFFVEEIISLEGTLQGREKSIKRPPCSLSPTRSRAPVSSGCSLNFGGKGQCDALWDLPKIIINTELISEE